MALLSLSHTACSGERGASPASSPAPEPPLIIPPITPPRVSPAAAVVARAPVVDPKPPPVRPVDPALPAEGWLLIGSTSTHAWVTAVVDDARPQYTAVVDLATGCAVESYPQPKMLADLRSSRNDRVLARAPNEANSQTLVTPESRAELRAEVGLAMRFGLTLMPFADVTWSRDGHHIFVVDGRLLHSADGGQTFQVIEEREIYSPAVTPDGKHVVYDRCRPHEPRLGTRCATAWELMSWAVDGESPPRSLGFGKKQGISRDGHVLLERRDASMSCLDHLDVATGNVDRSVCSAVPTSATPGMGVRWGPFSADGHFGAMEWWETRPRTGATIVTAIVDMKDGHQLRTVDDSRILGFADNGALLTAAISEGGGDHTYLDVPGKPKKRLGGFVVHDWDPASHRAIINVPAPVPRKTTLGKVTCKIVKAITLP